MVGAEHLLPDRERALVEQLGLGLLAPGSVEHGQVVQARGHVGMVGAEVLLRDLQRLPGDDDGTVVLSRAIKGHRFLIEDVSFNASALRAKE
jgi:hypothetical protein